MNHEVYNDDFDSELEGGTPETGRKGGAVYAAAASPWALPVSQPFALNTGLLIGSGVVASLVMAILAVTVPPAFGLQPMNFAQQLGTMFFPQGGALAFWTGLAMQNVNGVIFAAIYAGVLLAMRKQSTTSTGLAFGAILWLAAMLFSPLLMSMHPLVQSHAMLNPGVFMQNAGGWPVAFMSLGLHLVYGAIVGALYKHDIRER